MENNLENKVSMFQKSEGYLELHWGEISSIPAIVPIKNEFSNLITKILELASIADADITGFTVEKAAKRATLKKSILKISTAVVANASVSNNYAQVEKCDETPASMDAMRDNDFYTYAKLVINEATPVISALEPFGVVQADLDQALVDSDKFLDVIQKPKVQISDRSKTKDELETLVAETDTFLKKKLDKVMAIFQVTAPSLHVGYLSARSIDDTGTQTTPTYQGVAPKNSIIIVGKLNYLSTRSFDIKNTGGVPLSFCLSSSETAIEGNIVTVVPGGTATRKSSTLNVNAAANFLLLQNSDPALEGSYKIWITE